MQESGDFELRLATSRDVDGILDVQEPAAVLALGHIFPQDQYPFPRDVVGARWRAEIEDPLTHVYVAHDGAGRITGFAARHDDELLHFGTAADSWGTGLAQRLHDALLASFPPSTRRIRLRVFEQNHRARRFYERLGWTPTGAASIGQSPPFAVLLEYARSRRGQAAPPGSSPPQAADGRAPSHRSSRSAVPRRPALRSAAEHGVPLARPTSLGSTASSARPSSER